MRDNLWKITWLFLAALLVAVLAVSTRYQVECVAVPPNPSGLMVEGRMQCVTFDRWTGELR